MSRADADLLAAVAAIFRREHELVLLAVEVTIRPSEIGALFELDQFFRRQFGALSMGVELAPVFGQLVAAMLGGEEAAGPVEGKPLAIAQAGGETLAGRKFLAEPVGVVAPNSGSGFEFDARVIAGPIGHAVFRLTGIGRRTEIDVKRPFSVDGERMHRVVSGQRQTGDHDFGPAFRRDA